jgi:heat shock protein HslJ
VVGIWGREGTRGEPYLSLARNGTVSGSDGCNHLYGRWSGDGTSVSFSDMSSTAMACEGVDAWLSRLASARVDSDRLVVLDSSGAQIGTLERTG